MQFDAERLIRLHRVSTFAPAPCAQWAAVVVERLSDDEARYVSDLWRVPLDGGAAVQLTRGEQSDRAPAFGADGALYFISDRPTPADDTARPQVWRFASEGGEPAPVTDEPLGVAAFKLGAGADGDVMVVLARRWPGVADDAQRAHQDKKTRSSGRLYRDRPVRFWDHWSSVTPVHVRAYRDGAATNLTPDGLADAEVPSWGLSADGARAVMTRRRVGSDGIQDLDIAVLDTRTGATTVISGGDRVELEQPHISPDGRWLVCVRNARHGGPGFRPRVVKYDLHAPESAPEALAHDWNLVPRVARFCPDGQSLLVVADVHGQTPVWRLGLDGETTRLTTDGAHSEPRWVGDRLVTIRSTIARAPELWAGDAPLASLSGWTDAEADAIVVDELTCPGANGDPVHGFIVRAADATDPQPMLFWIHGGPMSANSNTWHWRWNGALAAHQGYTVVLPNPRGSTGYGEQFMNEVWGNVWGAACYDDLMAYCDAASQRPDVDATRRIAMGGSFGGYMCNWIGTQTDRFAALISHAGLFHLPQFRGTTDDGDWFAWGLLADPKGDPDATYDRYSPHAHLDGYTTPTLVIHGEKDYRVPVSEALVFFDALQRRDVPSELLIYPDENHWILKPWNVVDWYRNWVDFAARQLAMRSTSS